MSLLQSAADSPSNSWGEDGQKDNLLLLLRFNSAGCWVLGQADIIDRVVVHPLQNKRSNLRHNSTTTSISFLSHPQTS